MNRKLCTFQSFKDILAVCYSGMPKTNPLHPFLALSSKCDQGVIETAH
jgi:hypothetical protein